MSVSLFLNVEYKLNVSVCLAILSAPCVNGQQDKCPKDSYWSSAFLRSWNKHSTYSEWVNVCVLLNAKLAIIPLIYHSENKIKHRYSLYTKLKRLVVFLWCQLTETTVHGRYAASLGHIILIPSQSVFDLSP
jgi:hypothetical protein